MPGGAGDAVRLRTAGRAGLRDKASREEDAMILIIFDPRTGERVRVEIADTPRKGVATKPTRA